MFDWINDIAQGILALFPRWDLLEPTEGGVKFRPKNWYRQLEDIALIEPGTLYWWWPVTTVVYTIETKRQTLTFGQRLTTKDQQSVQLNTVIVFTINDVLKALVETRDFEDTVGEVAQKLSVKPIMSRTFEQILESMADNNNMRNEVTSGARTLLKDFGCNVIDGYISDFTKTEVFSHDGDGMVFGHGDEE